MRITVVGGGKMGLPLACMFAHRGADVTVCDLDRGIVDSINRGIDPHGEPEQGRYVRDGTASGRLRATIDTTAAVAQSNAVVVLVSAKLTPARDIDWGNLIGASKAVAKGLKPRTIVSYETTMPIGGTRNSLVPVLAAEGLHPGTDFSVIFSPERVKSRHIFERLLDTPKVVGGIDGASAAAGEAFYARWLGAPVINVGSLEAAEFVKLAGMVYRDVNIAVANELSLVAESMKLDVWPLLKAANTDGETYLLQPGIGVGGHCTPVYPHFLINQTKRLGLDLDITKKSRALNERQPLRQLQRLSEELDGLAGKHVHILGLSFRPQVKEASYSPAYGLQAALVGMRARSTIEDPMYSNHELVKMGFAPARVGQNRMDAVILNTAHPEFAQPDFATWSACGVKAVLDGRGTWSRESVEAAGLAYIGVGRA